MEKGKLIVVEGASDGIGKSTQYDLLSKRLERDGKQINKHHFPSYDTYYGKPVEMYLHGEYGNISDLSPYFINGLYAMDRAIAWHSELKKHYDNGEIILLDRYTTSSLIYQSALIEDIEEKKAFIDYVCDFEYNKLMVPKPDCVVFLHAPLELITQMRSARNKNAEIQEDLHERDLAFMKKVYDSAMFVADYLGWDMIDCSGMNQIRSIEDIHNDVYKLVRKKC